MRPLRRNTISCFLYHEAGYVPCGSKFIYDGTFSGRKIPGEGMAVEYLRRAGFRVFAEEDIEESGGASCPAGRKPGGKKIEGNV